MTLHMELQECAALSLVMECKQQAEESFGQKQAMQACVGRAE